LYTSIDISSVDIDEKWKVMLDKSDVMLLTRESFQYASKQLEQCLSIRLAKIQEYCQTIDELELERINQVDQCVLIDENSKNK
jgi:hypothetical protein